MHTSENGVHSIVLPTGSAGSVLLVAAGGRQGQLSCLYDIRASHPNCLRQKKGRDGADRPLVSCRE